MLRYLDRTSLLYNMTKQTVIFHGAIKVIERQFLDRLRLHRSRMKILKDHWKGEAERQMKQLRDNLGKAFY